MPIIETDSASLIIVALISYFIGSIPFGIVFAHLFGLGDLRQIGSGNIGATNVLRTGSKAAAVLTFLFDGLKGGIVAVIAKFFLAEDAAQLAALCAFLGHLFPIYLSFKGGKGISTFFGTFFILSPFLFFISMSTWFMVTAITRYSSAGGLTASYMALIVSFFIGPTDMLFLATIFFCLVVLKHRENIKKLIQGKESQVTINNN